MPDSQPIVCRFAPSPTGFLHVGGARSALFNYLFAKQNNGKLILRIEDTDKERSKPEYEKDILDAFEWLQIDFDETYRQSERLDIHKKQLARLLESGAAFHSKEMVTEAGQRSDVIRFKNPNKHVAFDDLIKGRVEFDTTELGDFVIAKSEDEPIFHLANVIDDADMGITHIIRGEEHISNTPRQILLWEALGVTPPIYAHIPLILAPDRSKLSKRKHGETVSVKYYRDRGYLPEALTNYLAFLGWNPGDEREVLSRDVLIKEFRLDKVQKGGAIFSVEKLNWMNKAYLLQAPRDKVIANITDRLSAWGRFSSFTLHQIDTLAALVLDRIHYFGEIEEMLTAGEFDYLLQVPSYKKEALLWSKHPDPETAKKHLAHVISLLSGTSQTIDAPNIKSILLPYAEKEGKGEVLWPLRFALSGREKSIDPFNLVAILGRDESVVRLQNALFLLQ
ncbi:MAG TPA: glutamate--tRNA ligase family protein [Candidatus Paceibacterota bacterium]